MPKITGAAMKQGAQLLSALVIKEGDDGFGAGGHALEGRQAFGIERTNGVTHGLVTTTEGKGNLGSALGTRRGEQNLAAPDGKGVGSPQTLLKGRQFGSRQGTDIDGGSHGPVYHNPPYFTKPLWNLH
jgi:hypothetical protein